jgi:hypothetical protein
MVQCVLRLDRSHGIVVNWCKVELLLRSLATRFVLLEFFEIINVNFNVLSGVNGGS